MNIGSLFSGYGGLDMAVCGDLAWVCDNDLGATKILTHRYPGIPNLGDVTTVDWATVQPVDVLTAGFPCQPVSHAGKRKGTDDERWLFDEVCRALGNLDPPPGLCLFENVVGLLSANRGDAMARVVGGLAESGYVGRWRTVRASDVGAPHRRERVFIVAHPASDQGRIRDRDDEPSADAGRLRGEPRWVTAPGKASSRRALALSRVSGGVGAAPDTSGDGRDERRPQPARLIGGHDAPLSGAGSVADTDDGTDDRERARTEPGGRGSTPADAAAIGCGTERRNDGLRIEGLVARYGTWGEYAPAIHRWGHVLARPAPPPTEPGRTGQPRLSPAFVEWMMGLPAGWVTDVPGLTRNDQLKALGNGVVPQQATAALALLLTGQVAA